MNNILATGDELKVSPFFGTRIVTLTGKPEIRGSGLTKISGRAVCVLGDEKTVNIAATYYLIAGSSQGTGFVTIDLLGEDQKSQQCQSDGKPLLKQGTQFVAKFTPTVPAVMTATNTPDPTAPTTSIGFFFPSQIWASAA
ncbi:hypothetical protein [Burkholderia ubonensis]|uniref:hypothetical protein n=1 Tax=Burkholderia ubonensis TaxID=101571 RepID=UPI000753D4C3|nr:hypothetical protein [Burkholderia ubonensis]KWN65851.1 hypothetical protein WM23_07635 [Burkholderia ubonensis]